MDNLIVYIIIATVAFMAVISFVCYFKRRNTVINDAADKNDVAVLADKVNADEIISIPIELLPSNSVDENKISLISDETVISRISALMPESFQIAAKRVNQNLADKAIDEIDKLKNAEIYRVIFPSGEKLDSSRKMKGAFRASYRKPKDVFRHGKRPIKGNANLIKPNIADLSKASKISKITNVAANVMDVGSLIVGQYYMASIDKKLEYVSDTVKGISEYQERDFKAQTISLLTSVGKISKYRTEILSNEEQRKMKYEFLENDLSSNAVKLLAQVNEEIRDITNKNTNLEYNEYVKRVERLNILVGYRNILLNTLEIIAELTYLLGRGSISTEQCYSVYNTLRRETEQVKDRLIDWHNKQAVTLNIDLDKNRKLKTGIEGLLSALPALLIDEKWKYEKLNKGLAKKIGQQRESDIKALNSQNAFYDDDVQIIIKDGKYYYLYDDSEK